MRTETAWLGGLQTMDVKPLVFLIAQSVPSATAPTEN
jgi:hypothetical protein